MVMRLHRSTFIPRLMKPNIYYIRLPMFANCHTLILYPTGHRLLSNFSPRCKHCWKCVFKYFYILHTPHCKSTLLRLTVINLRNMDHWCSLNKYLLVNFVYFHSKYYLFSTLNLNTEYTSTNILHILKFDYIYKLQVQMLTTEITFMDIYIYIYMLVTFTFFS